MRILARYEAALYVVLRIVAGLLFACHGAQKLFGLFGNPKATETLMLAAGSIELVTGLLVAIGLFTSIAAFVASGEMAAAYFMAHASNGALPIQNHGELAVVYCFLFLYMAGRGGGQWMIRD